MTVVASTADIPPQGYNTGLGKGAQLLSDISQLQTIVNSSKEPFKTALSARLNLLQMEAVDYFMGSFWVSADQILLLMGTAPNDLRIISRQEKNDPKSFTNLMIAAIAFRLAEANALIAAGTPVSPFSGAYSQYSRAYPPPNSAYPLTLPDVKWYALNVQLVDYYMAKAILPASLILSTMTGAQTYPWNGYTSNYTFYQQYFMNASY